MWQRENHMHIGHIQQLRLAGQPATGHGHWSGTWRNGDSGTSYKRWPDGRSENTDPDVRLAPPYGSAQWRVVPGDAARLTEIDSSL